MIAAACLEVCADQPHGTTNLILSQLLTRDISVQTVRPQNAALTLHIPQPRPPAPRPPQHTFPNSAAHVYTNVLSKTTHTLTGRVSN